MNILTIDGGGSKGVYTLGVLNELEKMTGKPLYQTFDYIYGTSTGSIIAALIGLGYTVAEIQELYYAMIQNHETHIGGQQIDHPGSRTEYYI